MAQKCSAAGCPSPFINWPQDDGFVGYVGRVAMLSRGAWRRAGCCLALLLGLAQTVRAEVTLDLPAQNLDSALQAFSHATGMAQALGLLLTGSGLMARYARSDAFTLQAPEVSQPATTRGLKAGHAARINNSYAAALQQAIERSLCRSPLTRPGSFRALVQVWVNAGWSAPPVTCSVTKRWYAAWAPPGSNALRPVRCACR
eukprot:gene18877-22480_t